MPIYNFKKIQVVPNGKDFVDIVLTRTQRKTPTVIHKHYPISQIRKFYMRKVKFTQQTIHDKLTQILTDFPMLDELHPFYADLLSVLYSRDHYKLALSQLNTARHLVDTIAKDYVRLLKFGDSLYRCKQLKRAALGRMVKVLSKNGPSLAYLEQVRQHLARLPSIDPNTRTLLLCGYPNVGKSSFMNKITRANVDVQPYPFTTKSLFVGHMDYKYLRFQVIDTPGILDHPLEERNLIEMQAITALAHLRCAVLFILDISEHCGYSITQQVSLFHSIKPLFANKPLVVVLNKVDVRRPEQLSSEEQEMINDMIRQTPGADLMYMSAVSEENITAVKEVACEKLLKMRTELKLKSKNANEIASKLHVSMPIPRDTVERLPFIPETVGKSTGEIAAQRLKEWEEQQELYREFDPEYRGVDWRKRYLLENDEWKYDRIPEIIDGKNIADFIDIDIEKKLEALEREEAERLQRRPAYLVDPDDDIPNLTPEEMEKVKRIRQLKALLIERNRRMRDSNSPTLPKKFQTGTISEFETHLQQLGIDPSKAVQRLREESRSRSKSRSRTAKSSKSRGRQKSKESSVSRRDVSMTPKPGEGFKNSKQKILAQMLARKALQKLSREGRKGEADRHIPIIKPKHMHVGIGGGIRRRNRR
jgi:nucleolar GTP-binding protein